MNDSRARRYAAALGLAHSRTAAVMAVADDEQAELRAEVERLRRWKAEATEVILGLQDVGRALGLGLGERITGSSAVNAAERLTSRAETAEAKVARVEALAESWAQGSERVSAKTLCAAMLRLALADHKPEHIDDSDICEDCNARHAGACS